MKSFFLSSLAGVLLWGLYPVAVALGDYDAPLFAATLSTVGAGVLWSIALVASPVPLGPVLGRAWAKLGVILLSGALFAAEVGLFYAAVKRSPQTAAVLFEVWVLAFVVFSQIRGTGLRLRRKDWVFLCFGLIGVSVAVVDVRSMLAGGGSVPDPLAVAFALLSGCLMAVKTYLNAGLAKDLHDGDSVAVASAPHLFSAIVAVPVWLVWAAMTGEPMELSADQINVVGLVALIYALGVPAFIFAVSVRPNDAAMAVFYTIPLVAIAFLYLFGLGDLTFYFVLGASIIVVSNAMVAQPTSYVSAAGLAAVLTLLGTYFAVSVQTDILPDLPWLGMPDTPVSIELLLVFYGLLFAFVLTAVIETNQTVQIKTDIALRAVFTADMSVDRRRAAYRRILRLGRAPVKGAAALATTAANTDDAIDALELEYRALLSGSTPTGIFRVFSVGVLLILLGSFCLSDILLERLVGLLILSCVLYFVFYSRNSYLRRVTYPQLRAEALAHLRPHRHAARYASGLATHLAGMWLFVFALVISVALNIMVSIDPDVVLAH